MTVATLSGRWLVAALLCALAPVLPAHASAEPRPLTLVVGAGAGSVFDDYARILARYIGGHLPDRPRVVVRNMAGGGGSVAAEYLYREARPDGRTAGNWAGDLVLKQLFGTREVRLDARRFAWVGTLSTLHPVCVLTTASGIDDLAAWSGARRPVRLGAIGRNEPAGNMARALGAALGLPVKVIDGFRGPASARLAAAAHEVQGSCWYWQAVRKAWRKMLAARNARVVLQAMTEPHPDLPSVPNALDLAKSEDARTLLTHGVHDPAKIARAWSLPPGTPDAQVAVLRKALADTAADPSFVADAAALGLEVRPLGGVEVEKTVRGLFDLGPKRIVRLRKVLFPEAPAGGDRAP